VVTRRFLAVASLLAITGCTIQKQPTPGLNGPSELGLSIELSVTPDAITQDGRSEATISALVRNATSQPVVGLGLRVDIAVGGAPVDFGALVSRTLFTDSAGRATTRYIAPAAPPAASGAGDVRVHLVVTPIGSNYANAVSRAVEVLVSPPGVRLGPNGTPTPAFNYSPTTPKELEAVFFDASASRDDDQIVSYAWSFGDGGTGSGERPSHAYQLAGKYVVTLTVTDNRGLSASTTQEVTVGANLPPTANFDISPTDPVVGQVVHVNAQKSTAAPGRAIVSWEWDFGDGTYGSGELSSRAYDRAGTFTITLRVRDNTGAVGAASKTVTVKP
jgi:PKD repeat protein